MRPLGTLAAAVMLLACPAASAQQHDRHGESAACTADATGVLVRAFAAGYSTGHVAEIVRMWAPEPRFQWFSTGPPGRRLGSGAYDRATLTGYFRSRVRAHERIRVLRVRAGYDAARDIVHFNGKLVRSADDLRPRTLDFKGAADCEGARPSLIVWSM